MICHSLKRLIACFMLALFVSNTNAQELKIGDKMPGLTLKNVLNYKTDEIDLSDLGGKLLIFEFWGPTCLSCIRAFPKIDSLQKAFGGQVQFIMVNKDSKDSTKRFFNYRKRIKMPAVPFVTGDKVLRKLFPHVGEPFCVWVDQQGVVQSKSGDTKYNDIAAFLKGKVPDIANFIRSGY